MKRRSISLYPTFESIVRDFQAELLRFLDRDVTFTEALNLLLLGAIMTKGREEVKQLGKDTLNSILDMPGAHTEGVLDAVLDEAIKQLPKKG